MKSIEEYREKRKIYDALSMGREIRRVPINWEHPRKENGSYKPLREGNFKTQYSDWEQELKNWYAGHKNFESGKVFSDGLREYSKVKGNTYEDWAGPPPSPPSPYDFLPQGTWYQLFENVSEGTPITPPFAAKEELIDWLSKNRDFWGNYWAREAAEDIVNSGFALSGIMANGRIYKPEEQYKINKPKA